MVGRNPKILWITLLLACAGAAACRGKTTQKKTAATPAAGPPPLVEAVPTRKGRLPLEVRLTGTVRARNQVEIRAELALPIVEVLVRSGQLVRKGQPLVRLQDDDLHNQQLAAEADVAVAEAAVQAAEARVLELEAQLGATRDLASKRLASDLELAAHQAQLAVARANVKQARARVEQVRAVLAERRSRLERAVVRAPVAGRVGRRNAEVGMLANPATVLFVMGNINDLLVEIPLHEKHIGQVRPGADVTVSAPAVGLSPQSSKISRISPFLTAGSFSTTAEIDLHNADGLLRPGMFVTVDVHSGQSDEATLLPRSALWKDPRSGGVGVFVVKSPVGETQDDEVRPMALQPVEVLAEGREVVGVAGLEANVWVVSLGQHLLAAQREPRARVRPQTWSHALHLQGRHESDLLDEFLVKQRELARTLGAAPPRNDAFVSGTSRTPATNVR